MRTISAVRVNSHGFVSHVRGDLWGERTARHALEDIEMGMHAYDVKTPNHHCLVLSAHEGLGVYLYAHEPDSTENALLALPRF